MNQSNGATTRLPVASVLLRRIVLAVLFAVCVGGILTVYYVTQVEPRWLAVRELDLTSEANAVRLAHISDLHFVGDTAYLERIVARLNHLAPDAVCFTGDLVDGRQNLAPALERLRRLRMPLFGVPGNHDIWSGEDRRLIEEAFAATGGAWLADRSVASGPLNLCMIGYTGHGSPPVTATDQQPGKHRRRVLLVHHPLAGQECPGGPFDLILAGHSHGGQVRLPFVGAVVLPWGVGPYDRGYYDTRAGPLHVSPGLGTFFLKARFGCRPEITVIRF